MDIREIDRIVVSLINTNGANNEMARLSVLAKSDPKSGDIGPGILSLETYGGQGIPKAGGLIDPRMGTSDDNVDCETCGFNKKYCVGHFGHIELCEPICHEGYVPVMKNILSCICVICGNLLVSPDIADSLNKGAKVNVLKKLKKASESIKFCNTSTGCGAPVAKIKLISGKGTPKRLQAELLIKKDGHIKKSAGEFTSTILLGIFKKISNETWARMGFDPQVNRPEFMMIKTLPIPPIQVRPTVKVDSGGMLTKHDDLTHIISEIFRFNAEVEKQKGNAVNKANAMQHLYLVASNLVSSKTTKGEKATKSIADRIGKKGGRIRGQLMAKRVDFCARTVISPDTTIAIDEIRIPIKIAMTCTFPEVVNEYNIITLTEMLKNGKHKYPGVNTYKSFNPETGKFILFDLEYKDNNSIKLKKGDVVERHLVDGDAVMACRQPSLHKHSMMVHKAKVERNYDICSFGLSLPVTTPYNADFKHPRWSQTGDCSIWLVYYQ